VLEFPVDFGRLRRIVLLLLFVGFFESLLVPFSFVQCLVGIVDCVEFVLLVTKRRFPVYEAIGG